MSISHTHSRHVSSASSGRALRFTVSAGNGLFLAFVTYGVTSFFGLPGPKIVTATVVAGLLGFLALGLMLGMTRMNSDHKPG